MKRGGKSEGEMVRMEMEKEMEMKYKRKAYRKEKTLPEDNMLICEEL